MSGAGSPAAAHFRRTRAWGVDGGGAQAAAGAAPPEAVFGGRVRPGVEGVCV